MNRNGCSRSPEYADVVSPLRGSAEPGVLPQNLRSIQKKGHPMGDLVFLVVGWDAGLVPTIGTELAPQLL